jgi:hypothetical protein
LVEKVPIRLYAPEQETRVDALKTAIQAACPELMDLGFVIESSDTPSVINIIADGVEIPEVTDCSVPSLMCVVGEAAKPVVQRNMIIWKESSENLIDVLKAYLFRYHGIPFLIENRRALDLKLDSLTEQERQSYLLLNRVRDGINIEIPSEVEVGGTARIRITSLLNLSDMDTEVRTESSYCDTVAISSKDPLLLGGLQEGISTIRVFRVGEAVSIGEKEVSAVDYGYATRVMILINGEEKGERTIATGARLTFSARVEPENEKSITDLSNAIWDLWQPEGNDEKLEVDGTGIATFCPKTPGVYEITIRLARVDHTVRVVVKPCLEDFRLTLKQVPENRVKEQKTDVDGNITHVAAYVGTTLTFGIQKIPEDSLVPHAVSVLCPSDVDGDFVKNGDVYRISLNKYLGNKDSKIMFEFEGTGKKRVITLKTESSFNQPSKPDDTLLLSAVVTLSVINFFTLLLISNLSFFCVLFTVGVIALNMFALRKGVKLPISQAITKIILAVLGFAIAYALFMEFIW